MQPHELPRQWSWTKIAEIADVSAGNAAPQGERFFQANGAPFIRVQDLGRLVDEWYIGDSKDHITQDAVKSWRLRIIPQGAVLFTKSGMSTLLNQRAILSRNCYVVSHIGYAIPSSAITSEWLYLALKQTDFRSLSQATTLPSLKLSKVREITIPLPPLEQQTKIIDKTKELLGKLRLAKRSLNIIPSLIKQFRRSALAKAFRGELTQRDLDDDPADRLLERIDQDRRKKWQEEADHRNPKLHKYEEPLSVDNGGLQVIPEHWTWTRLDHVADVEMGQSPPGSSYNSERKGTPLLNGPTEFGPEHPNPVQWTTKPTKMCFKGDILICVRGNTTGRMNIADNNYCIGRGLAAIRPVSKLVSRELISHFLLYKTREIMERTAGSTFPNLPGEQLKSFPFPLAPIHEQKRIVSMLEMAFRNCDMAQNALENSLDQTRTLERSILDRAFRGDLVSQDSGDDPRTSSSRKDDDSRSTMDLVGSF